MRTGLGLRGLGRKGAWGMVFWAHKSIHTHCYTDHRHIYTHTIIHNYTYTPHTTIYNVTPLHLHS